MPALKDLAANTLGLAGSYLASAIQSRSDPQVFDGVNAFCLFIGYPHSGHSLVGALLDAHPNIIIAHELGVLKHVFAGFGKAQLYYLLLENSRRFAASGRLWNGYSYIVPEQWQGKFTRLSVLGDKKGHGTTAWLGWVPSLLGRLRKKVGVPVKLIHVIRNPYDNIATIFTRKHRRDPNATLSSRAQLYFSLCATVSRVRGEAGPAEWHEMRHESFVRDPRSHLEQIASFLGVDAPGDWLDACAGIVFKMPRRTRQNVNWDAGALSLVSSRLAQVDYLQGYTFESDSGSSR